MKISGSKNASFKQIALKHSEKAGMAVIALIVFLVLLKTEWGTIQKTPEQLTEKAADATIRVNRSQWTDEERGNHPVDTGWPLRLAKMTEPIDVGLYGFDVRPWFPMREMRLAMRAPIVNTLDLVIANPGRVFNQIKLVTAEATDATDDPGNVKPRKTPGRQFIPGSEYKKDKKKKDDKKKEDGGIPGIQKASSGKKDKVAKPGVKSIDGIGRRYIVVLGVFDLDAQLKEFARAMGLRESMVRKLAVIAKFSIQRRRVDQAGKELSEWAELDESITLNILFKESVGFEQEIIDSKYANSVILSPLPSIVPDAGEWDDYDTVIHPSMAAVESDQQKLQKKIDDIIREYIEKENRKKKGNRKIEGYGTRLQGDSSTPEKILNDKEARERIIDEIKNSGEASEEDVDIILEMLDSRLRQSKLMFRYFDFDVQPHQLYQHRVKISMINPLTTLQKKRQQAASKKVTKDDYIESEWSKSTPPTSTGDDYSFYLTDATKERSLGALPTINVELYQWIQKYGMYTKAIFSSMVVGNPIGGSKKTDIPNPLFQEYKMVNVDFDTDNYLVDIDSAPNLNNDVQNALSLSRGFIRDAGLTEQITVLDEYGHLKVIDKLALRAERKGFSESLEMYNRRFDHLKKQKKKAKGNAPGLGGGPGR